MPPVATAANCAERQLIVAIHKVSPRLEAEVDRLCDLLAPHIAIDKLALLVVPSLVGDARPLAGSPFASRLRNWADRGAQIFVHGWGHGDRTTLSRRPASRARASVEAEFLHSDLATSRRRMTDGKRLIEDVIGHPAAGFVAPDWLYGPDALAALAESGFPLAEDSWTVWRPASGEFLCTGPVIAWASRSGPHLVSSLMLERLPPAMLHALPVLRIALDPEDTAAPCLAGLDRMLERFCRRRTVVRYDDLVPAGI